MLFYNSSPKEALRTNALQTNAYFWDLFSKFWEFFENPLFAIYCSPPIKNLLPPTLAELNVVRKLYGIRVNHKAQRVANDTANTGGASGGDPITSQNQMDQLAITMSTMMGVNYNLSDHISAKFSGSILKFPSWLEQIELGLTEMERLHKSKAQMLIEVKSCL